MRVGHPSFKVIKLVPALDVRKDSDLLNKHCDTCHRAKHKRDIFPLSDNKAFDLFELIHCDLWGPYRTAASCGAYYLLTIEDDFSRAVWDVTLVDKTEVSTLKNFFAMVNKQFKKHVKIVRSDNGIEFAFLKNYFLEHGIVFHTSCVSTPQQNGRVERKHQHIMNVARTLRFQGNLPIKFWGECVLTVGYLINRTPSMVFEGKTPHEVLHGKPPSYEHIRVLGPLCYAYNLRTSGDKFNSKS